MNKKIAGISWKDIVTANMKLKKKGYSSSMLILDEISEIKEVKKNSITHRTYGKNFNPSKRYQRIIEVSEFGTCNAHVIPINEFNQEDWECPRCHEQMQDIILFKTKKISCKHCGLELWRENHGKPMALY